MTENFTTSSKVSEAFKNSGKYLLELNVTFKQIFVWVIRSEYSVNSPYI